MAEEGKKISFGFAKSIKKPSLIKTINTQNEKKVDYIECIDEKAIKIIGGEEKKDEPLVIPLLGSKTWHDRIINKTDADIFEPKPSDDKETVPKVEIKQEPEDKLSNGDVPQAANTPVQLSNIKTEPSDETEVPKTLEEQAAREIIQDLKSSENEKQDTNTLALPVVENPSSLRGQEESTLEDYEQIPIDKFGVAMLRGMGWQPGKGIGRNEKVVAPAIPELRPKGMGLGADKMTLQKQKSNTKSNKSEEELILKNGSYVKFVAGKQNNSYGEVQGFDEDSGRLIVKMALGGNIISVNEFMVQPVTKSEYSKNAKILNAKKYEEYKNRGSSKTKAESLDSGEGEEEEEEEEEEGGGKQEAEEARTRDRGNSRRREERKKSKKKTREKSDSSSDSSTDRKARKRRSSSSSDSDYKSKKSKKSKKHRKRDDSLERSIRKSKKKDRDRDNKYSRRQYLESPEARKHKKHKRSRSRSRVRR